MTSFKSEHKGKGNIMSHVTFMSRIAAGACGAMIMGTAAIAQTSHPRRRRPLNRLWAYR